MKFAVSRYPALAPACVVSACVVLAVASPAAAKTCPSGQILRVSKGVCVEKAAALKDGVVLSGVVKRAEPKNARQAEIARQAEPKAETVALRTPREIEPKPSPMAQAYAPTSPFGQLRLDYFQR